MSTATCEVTVKPSASEPKELPIILSTRAADEVKRIVADQAAAGVNDTLYLRMRIVGGGCSGFQHKLDLDPTINEKLDETFEVHGVNVVIDKRSMLYLAGVSVDFVDDLNHRGFKIENPSAKTKCGCGSSFSMQDGVAVNHFERLGLPRRFSIDRAAVEHEYLARSRQVHPDFHANSTESVGQSAGLNEAYLCLKDDARRADYLLSLLGGPTVQEEKNLDQSLLFDMMERRERIEEARVANNTDALRELEADLESLERAILKGIAEMFALFEANPTNRERLHNIRRDLNALKTVRSLKRDLA